MHLSHTKTEIMLCSFCVPASFMTKIHSPSDIEALDVLSAIVAGGTHKHVEHVGDDEGVV